MEKKFENLDYRKCSNSFYFLRLKVLKRPKIDLTKAKLIKFLPEYPTPWNSANLSNLLAL